MGFEPTIARKNNLIIIVSLFLVVTNFGFISSFQVISSYNKTR